MEAVTRCTILLINGMSGQKNVRTYKIEGQIFFTILSFNPSQVYN